MADKREDPNIFVIESLAEFAEQLLGPACQGTHWKVEKTPHGAV